MECPECNGSLKTSKGSTVSRYLDLYHCADCSWKKLKCPGCDGHMEVGGGSRGSMVNYTCVQCKWNVVGHRL
jgi:hypothetical protein